MGKAKALRRDRKTEGLNNETGAPHGRTPASALTSYPDWASRKQKDRGHAGFREQALSATQ